MFASSIGEILDTFRARWYMCLASRIWWIRRDEVSEIPSAGWHVSASGPCALTLGRKDFPP